MAAPIDSHDSLSIQCQSFRDEANGLLAEYRRDSTTAARRAEIINRLRTIGSDWDSIGYRAAYGDVTIVLPGGKGFTKIRDIFHIKADRVAARTGR